MTDGDSSEFGFYAKKWSLKDPRKIAETSTIKVYRVYRDDLPLVLKILTPLGQIDEADGAIALRHFSGKGAVELLGYDKGAHLVSYIDGRSLNSIVTGGQDDQATEIVCDVLDLLHNSSPELPQGLTSMEQNFESLFAHAKRGDFELLSEAAKIASHLLSSGQERIVLHGDVHHKNIFESSTHGWLAIDPKGLIGERTYDYANIFYNPDDSPEIVERPERITSVCSIFSRRFDIDPSRILKFAFAYGCLSACWEIDDGLKPDRRLRIAKIIQELLK